jgi:hypothetical protein
MRKGSRSIVGVLLLVSTLVAVPTVRAQEAPAGPTIAIYQPTDSPDDVTPWVSADYLLWRIRQGPLPVPLVTSGSQGDKAPGALGQPHTVVLYGNRDIDFNNSSGLRLNAGVDFDADVLIRVEGGFFALEQRANSASFASSSSGSPLLARPLSNAFGSGKFDEVTSPPGSLAGTTTIASTSQLEGWDVNVSFSVFRSEGIAVMLLLGFRTLDLNERLSILDRLTPLVPGALSFRGALVSPPSTLSDFDSFHTSDKFYGAQIGARVEYQLGDMSVEAVAKLAAGTTQELTVIQGSTTLMKLGAAPATAKGGILAEPTNIGRHFHQVFSGVPEGDINLAYQVLPWIQLRMGYSGLYWSEVQRPGSAIDRTVNVNQIVRDPRFGTMKGGKTRPVFTSQQSDFWAQGITLGFVLSY